MFTPTKAPTRCPHCGAKPNDLAAHLRDTGDHLPLDACRVLFEKRNGQEAYLRQLEAQSNAWWL